MTAGPDAVAPLLERGAEMAAIEAAIPAGDTRGGRLLIIEAPAGIGKTTLMQEAQRRAREHGLRVLTACGGELEREFGFGVACQLFEAAADERLLSGRARLAAPVLGLGDAGRDGVQSGDAIFPALQGLYWLTVTLAERRPLALLVDDVHLADSASVRFLAYLARRLEELAVLVVVAARSGPEADQVLAALDVADVLRPQCLSLEGTQALLRSIAPRADDQVCRACHEATGGNALFVRELGEAIRARGLERGPEAAARLRSWSPGRVTRSVARRLTGLAPESRRLAHALAVLGQGATLRHARVLAGLEPTAAAQAADGLRATGILAGGEQLEFVHPIVRSAVDDEIGPSALARAHADAAQLLAAEGAPAERIAVHLLRSEPGSDPVACATLVAAAQQALIRGAPETATAYLRRALDEPPPTEERAGLLLALATAEGRIFDLAAATEHVGLAFELGADRDTRMRAALLAAALSSHSPSPADAVALLGRLLDEFPDRPEIITSLHAHIANTARFERGARESTRSISRALRREQDDGADPTVLAAMAAELAMAGEPAQRGIRLAQRGLRALDGQAGMGESTVCLTLIRVLVSSDEIELGIRELDRLMANSRSSGSVLDFVFASVFRADAMYRSGDLFEAEADARAAYELALEHRWPATSAIVAQLLDVLTERGEFGPAEDALTEAGLDGPAGELSSLYISNMLLLSRGRLRAAAGDPRRALDDLLECGTRQAAWEEVNPALIPWRSEAALVHHRLGSRAQAETLAAEELALARRFGAPRAIGMALRVAGVVVEGEPGLALAAEAVAVLAGSAARLEHARALADLGVKLGGSAPRPECQGVLREALELAHLCGAVRLERRIVVALREIGARPRQRRLTGPDALTPGERRVAQMAAGGLTNREIAEALFVTVRTIEFHLVNCYRKLRIAGRRELRAALADGPTTVRADQPAG